MPKISKIKKNFQAPTGTHDILPEDQKYYKKIYDTVENVANFYQFGKIDTPILEETELFSKGVGAVTDIVERQMYNLKTKGGDYLSLRPEETAPIARAYIENGMIELPQPVKLWYYGPFFRYESPQAGRYRQFHQFGFEVLGEKSAVRDVQVIQAFYNILKEFKIKDLTIEINSIGDHQCRSHYKRLLVNYFKSKEMSLCMNCRRRLKENPLRILDCKEEKCNELKSRAPQTIDHLCEECHTHFKQVLEFLDELELPYQLNPYLVRGLDYYTKTVFEIFENNDAGRKQGALVGGGRYDALIKLLGRKDVPACGGAGGVERIVNLMKQEGREISDKSQPKIFLAQLGESAKRKILKIFEEFRKARIPVIEALGKDSLKAQLKIADKYGVKYSLIMGQKEAIDGVVIIREMENGKQETVKLEKVVDEMKKLLKKEK